MGDRKSLPDSLAMSLYAVSITLVAGGAWSAWLGHQRQLTGSTLAAALLALTGAAGLLLPGYLRKQRSFQETLLEVLRGPYGLLLTLAVIFILAAFFLVVKPDAEAAPAFAPALIAVWTLGAGISIMAPGKAENAVTTGHTRTAWSVMASVILAYGILIVPAPLPGLLDGIPWDTPLEFGLALLGIPLALLFGRDLLGKRWALLSLLGVLVLKLICALALPTSGLIVRAYRDEAAQQAGSWEKSYASPFSSQYTQLMTRPYYRLREFPIEWINDRFGYDTKNFRLILEFKGYARLDANEQLVFLIDGEKQAQANLKDLETGEVHPAVILSNPSDLADRAPSATLRPGTYQIQGAALFDHFGKARLEPVIVGPDGAWHSALQAGSLFPSRDGTQVSSSQLMAFRSLLLPGSTGFLVLLLACTMVGMYNVWKRGILTTPDLYVAASALPLFLAARLVPKAQFNLFLIPVLLVTAAFLSISGRAQKNRPSNLAFLAGTGIVFLILFMSIDLENLRSVTSLPQWQDGIEYQTFARRIYLDGDALLKDTPPRAYKVLFPYLAGALHMAFGQSMVAQSFLSAWCAVLSALLMLRLGEHLRIPSLGSYALAIYYLLVLCTPLLYIIYFRFGLIEPFATLFLLLAIYLASRRRFLLMCLAGLITVLLRLDYLGMASAACVFSAAPLPGSITQAWKGLLVWLKEDWRKVLQYGLVLCVPPALIIAAYFLFVPGYFLNASDTRQTSLAGVLESMMRVVLGGSPAELSSNLSAHPAGTLLITAPLAVGFLLSLASLMVRRGLFAHLDMRLALLIPCLLPAYLVVRPAAYFPRFSLPLLPPELLLIGLVLVRLSRAWGIKSEWQ